MNRSDHLDRPLLGILSLLLMGFGGYALARSYGAFGNTQAHEPILIERVRTFIGHNDNWFWPVAFVVALLIAYLGYRLLLAKLSPSAPGQDLHVRQGNDDIHVRPSVVVDAIANDLTRDHHITHARGRLNQIDADPELDLEITIADDTDLEQLRVRIEHEILDRAQHAMESTPLHAHVTIALTRPTGRQLS